MISLEKRKEYNSRNITLDDHYNNQIDSYITFMNNTLDEISAVLVDIKEMHEHKLTHLESDYQNWFFKKSLNQKDHNFNHEI